MSQLSGAEAIVARLRDHGVDTVFGLPGGQLDHFFDAMYRDGGLRVIHSRHEQGAAYMAYGYAKSTGKVGTFGGVNIPPVTVFMDGFYYGVQKYNADNGTKVEVLGWNPADQKGLFTENFESLDDGRTFAQNLVDEGADIVMPVAGPVGLGSAALASELGTDKLMIIGVDADQFESDTANQNVYLTSVLKNMDVTTFNAIQAVVDGTFEGGVTVGDLKNGGVGLAPYHAFEDAVPQELKDQIEAIKAGIIDGSVSVKG